MTKKLVLLGYAHTDQSQRERIARAFARLAPSRITLELDTTHRDARKLPIMDAAILHARVHSIPVHVIDEGVVKRSVNLHASVLPSLSSPIEVLSPLLQKYIREYGSSENVPPAIRARIMANPFLDLEKYGIELGPDTLYDIYRKYEGGSISSDEMRAYFEGYGWQVRHQSDVLMAARIRRIFEQHEDGVFLHIGGLFHMVEINAAPALYELLKIGSLNPERLLLADF